MLNLAPSVGSSESLSPSSFPFEAFLARPRANSFSESRGLSAAQLFEQPFQGLPHSLVVIVEGALKTEHEHIWL